MPVLPTRPAPRRMLALLVAVSAGLAVAVLGAPALARSGSSSTHPVRVTDAIRTGAPAAVTAGAARRSARSVPVTLVTGDRLSLDVASDGTPSVTLRAPAGDRTAPAPLVRFTWDGDLYAVPAEAVPFLSTTLDPRLFDVSYLVRAGLDDTHASTLPVSIRHAGAGTPAALPSVHVASDSGGIAEATIDKANAASLGSLFAADWRAAYVEHRAASAGIGRISPAPSPGLPAAPPMAVPRIAGQNGPAYHTLTLNFIDHNGQPGTAVGWVQNVNDARLGVFVLNYPGVSGPARFSMPDGNYSIEVSVLTPHPHDPAIDGALTAKPQVSVSSDESITLDARTAVPFRAELTQPAVQPPVREDILTFTRTSAAGGGLRVEAFGFAGAFALIAMHLASIPENGNPALYAAPTAPVSTGFFGFQAFTVLAYSENGASTQPRYYLLFPSPGRVPDSLTYAVPAGQLTTVHSSTYAAASGACPGSPPTLFPMAYVGWSTDELGFASSSPLGARTDYWYSSDPAHTVWQDAYENTACTRLYGPRRTVAPGQTIAEVWNKAPLVPASDATYVQTPAAAFAGTQSEITDPLRTVCAACRQDGNALLYLQPNSDSDPGHYGDNPDLTVSRIRFSRDGVLTIASEASGWGGDLSPTTQDMPLLPAAASYRLDWDVARPNDPQAAVATSWVFHSAPGDPAATLPRSEQCAPDPARGCSFLPLLFVHYDLALDSLSRATAGAPFTIRFTVAHQQGQPAPAGVAATVSISADGGTTWSAPIPARSGPDGSFTAPVTNPAPGAGDGYVALRVQATDAAGNGVEQTILRSYALTS